MLMKIVSLVIFFVCLVQGREIIDHLDAQLKLINKPALKSFQTENGDIIDCIDIHKQLAFDHPLLKNHQIQMKPETVIQETTHNDYNNFSNYMPENVKCPPESVPIKRATREDLLISELMLKSKGPNNPAANNDNGNGPRDTIAMVVSKQESFGAKSVMNVWTPVVGDKQLSYGTMALQNGPQGKITSIQGGWMVSYQNPRESKLFILWTSPKNPGCYNTLCPGFVQVSSGITLGLVLKPSKVFGPQVEFAINIYQDRPTRNWWLMVNNKYVGYWPNAVVQGLSEGANAMWLGGGVYSPPRLNGPQMGSGHYPDEGPGKVAYIRHILALRKNLNYENPEAFSYWLSRPECYNAIHYRTPRNPPTVYMYFGGPGGKCQTL